MVTGGPWRLPAPMPACVAALSGGLTGHPPGIEARETDWRHLSVEDTGPGIPEAMRPNIFDPFFLIEASGRRLGLSAVRSIVRSLGMV